MLPSAAPHSSRNSVTAAPLQDGDWKTEDVLNNRTNLHVMLAEKKIIECMSAMIVCIYKIKYDVGDPYIPADHSTWRRFADDMRRSTSLRRACSCGHLGALRERPKLRIVIINTWWVHKMELELWLKDNQTAINRCRFTIRNKILKVKRKPTILS